jgi:hypothetical protein
MFNEKEDVNKYIYFYCCRWQIFRLLLLQQLAQHLALHHRQGRCWNSRRISSDFCVLNTQSYNLAVIAQSTLERFLKSWILVFRFGCNKKSYQEKTLSRTNGDVLNGRDKKEDKKEYTKS